MEELAVEVRGSYGAYYKVNPPLINPSLRTMAYYTTQNLKRNVDVPEAVIRLLLNASDSRLSPVLAKLTAAAAKLASLSSLRQPLLLFGFRCSVAVWCYTLTGTNVSPPRSLISIAEDGR